MEVKFDPGARFLPQTPARTGAQQGGGVSFAAALRNTAHASAAGKADFASISAEAVFEKAFSDRGNPDLGLLDSYLEWKIAREP